MVTRNGVDKMSNGSLTLSLCIRTQPQSPPAPRRQHQGQHLRAPVGQTYPTEIPSRSLYCISRAPVGQTYPTDIPTRSFYCILVLNSTV